MHSSHLSGLRCLNACVTRTRAAARTCWSGRRPLLHGATVWPGGRVRGGEGSGRSWARGRGWVFDKLTCFFWRVVNSAWPATLILGGRGIPSCEQSSAMQGGGLCSPGVTNCSSMGLRPCIQLVPRSTGSAPSRLGWDRAGPGRRCLPLKPSLAGASGRSHEQPTAPLACLGLQGQAQASAACGPFSGLGWAGLEWPRGLIGGLALSCCLWCCSGAS